MKPGQLVLALFQIAFFTILFETRGAAQSAIAYEDVYQLSFYTPDLDMKKSRIRTITEAYTIEGKPGEYLQISYYDKQGFILTRKTTDKIFSSTSEEINFNNRLLTVNRRIPGDLIAHPPKTDFPGFWNSYRPILSKIKNSNDEFLNVTTKYAFAKDSSLKYETWANGSFVDSGMIVVISTMYCKDSKGKYVRCPNAKLPVRKIDKKIVKDTLVEVERRVKKKNEQSATDKYFVKGKLVKIVYLKYFYNRTYITQTSNYTYDALGREIEERIGNGKGQWWKIKQTRYDDVHKTYEIRLDEMHNGNGSFDRIEKYSSTGKLLEHTKILYLAEVNELKTVYSYSNDSLLQGMLYFVNGKETERKLYTYTFW